MKITEKDVDYIANLARLELEGEHKEKMQADLENILEYIDLLNEVNTDDVEPTAHVLPVKNVLREDKNKSSVDRQFVLDHAIESNDEGFFIVPKVI